MRRLMMAAAVGASAAPALADSKPPQKIMAPKPIVVGGITIKPILDLRLREEIVERDAPLTDASALTLRGRAGVEISSGPFAWLTEGEATVGIVNHYNDTIPFNGVEPHAIIADPRNVELNRLQVQYRSKKLTVTLGRQRINLDDQRFVGSSGWRQNEQTFDAVRGEAKVGPLLLDETYSQSQRTVFGRDAGARTAFSGNFWFLGAGFAKGPVAVKAFSYLLDYREPIQFAFSSQTCGARATFVIPLSKKAKLNLAVSVARQSNYKSNPLRYSATYLAAEAGTTVAGFGLTAGYEKLGSDKGRSVQTPMATLHKFNGWADLFLTTPVKGLQDGYVTIGRKFGVKALPGLNAGVTYHRFDSDVGDVRYGHEWDAVVGFKRGRMSVLTKLADYRARSFGVNTRKGWLQLEWTY